MEEIEKENQKKYFWLKLPKIFFEDARIKKLRRIAGGDTYVVIFLKMMLLVINNDGIFIFEGIEKTLAEELALILDEDEDNVKVVLSFLLAQNELIEINDVQFLFNRVPNMIGKEGESAARVRKHREKLQALHCNDGVTECNDSVTHSKRKIEKKKKEKNLEILSLPFPKIKVERVDFKNFKNKLLELCPSYEFKLPYPNSLNYIQDHKGFCLKNDHIYDLQIEKFISKDDSFIIWEYLFSVQDEVFEFISKTFIDPKSVL